MPKGQNSGGRIPPDNRPTQAPGVGKNAKRHDLERQATPGLQNSDLQYGDVKAMEQGQRVAPIRTQQSAAAAPVSGQGGGGNPPPAAAPMQRPDPINFIASRQKMQVPQPLQMPQRRVDVASWTPLVAQIANTPSASGALRQAFINQYAALSRRPYVPDVYIVDMQALDQATTGYLDNGGR